MMISIKIIFVSALLMESNKCIFSIPSIGDIQEIANFANDAWGVLTGELPISALFTGSTGIMLDKILDAVGKISEKLDDVIAVAKGNSIKLNHMNNLLHQLMADLPREAKLDALTREFNAYIDRIDFLYDRFTYYSADRENFNEKTIGQFVNGIVSFETGDLQDVLHRLHHLFLYQGAFAEDTLLYMLVSKSTTEKNTCGATISPQMRIYNIYKVLTISEIRSYVMTLFAYSIRKVYDNATYYDELRNAKDQLIIRSKNLIQSFKISIKNVSRRVEKCDQTEYEEDVTYVKFTNGYWSPGDVGHAFYTRFITTNIEENMVATGVRFVKENELIYIQLKEAKLLPQGNVDLSTERWIPVPEIEIKSDEHGGRKYYRPGFSAPAEYPTVFVLNHLNRSMFLDQVVLPPDTLITGIDLDYASTGDLYLDVRGTEFDFETGKLLNESYWFAYYSVSGRPVRRYVDLNSKLNPLTAVEPRMMTGYKWFEFSFTRDDGAHAPFFDSRTLQLNPRGPLSGIGLGLRMGREDAGILNFQIYSIDYSQYMNSTM